LAGFQPSITGRFWPSTEAFLVSGRVKLYMVDTRGPTRRTAPNLCQTTFGEGVSPFYWRRKDGFTICLAEPEIPAAFEEKVAQEIARNESLLPSRRKNVYEVRASVWKAHPELHPTCPPG
jgi:hypothetical protein